MSAAGLCDSRQARALPLLPSPHLCTHWNPTPLLCQKTFDPGFSFKWCFLGPSPVECPDRAITRAGFGDSACPLPLPPPGVPCRRASHSLPCLTAWLPGSPVAQSPLCGWWLGTACPNSPSSISGQLQSFSWECWHSQCLGVWALHSLSARLDPMILFRACPRVWMRGYHEATQPQAWIVLSGC